MEFFLLTWSATNKQTEDLSIHPNYDKKQKKVALESFVPQVSEVDQKVNVDEIKDENGVPNRSVVEQNQITAAILSRLPLDTSLPFLTLYRSRGRLGNQMFQMASLIGIALEYNYTPLIPAINFDIGNVFDLTSFPQVKIDISNYKQLQEGDLSQYERDITKFIPTSELVVPMDRSLDGYFQSYKHFNEYESDIRWLLRFKKEITDETTAFIEKNVDPITIKVGIHVRRGDFLSSYHASLGRTTVDSDYIQRAMNIYKARYANITFIVFSNDMAWCKQYVRDERNRIVFSPFQHPGHDLAVMSKCDHMIISVGTFGWWGGWLAGGSVVYFTGYPRPGSEIDRYFVKADYYPPHWIGLP